MTRRKLKKCPIGGHPSFTESIECEADEEQLAWGYPKWFNICEMCYCPLLEIGTGHCKPFERNPHEAHPFDRCPACRRKLENHPGLFPTCRQLTKLKRAVRAYIKVVINKTDDPVTKNEKRRAAWSNLWDAL